MSFTPPHVASPNKSSLPQPTKMIDREIERALSSSTSYSDGSYSDSEESFKVIEINRSSTTNNSDSTSHNRSLAQQRAKNLHSELQSLISIPANKSRKSEMEIAKNCQTEEKKYDMTNREDMINVKDFDKKLTLQPDSNKNHQSKQRADGNHVIATGSRLSQTLSLSSSYSSYSHSETKTTSSLTPTNVSKEQEELEYSSESATSPHVETKVPSQESLSSSYTEEYTQTEPMTAEEGNKRHENNASNSNGKKLTKTVYNYTNDDDNFRKNETSISASYSSYSKLSASNSTITQKEKTEEDKHSKLLDVNYAKKESALQQSHSALLPTSSSSSSITSYYTSESSLEQKANKSRSLAATPLVAAEKRLSTSTSSSYYSSYKYSPSSLTSSQSLLLEKQKKPEEPEMELHQSLQELSSMSSKRTSTASSSSLSSEEKEELEEEKLQKEYAKNELTVVRVEQVQQPITPALPKRCFVHPLIWHSTEGVYDSKLEDATSTFLEQLLEMQYNYESIKMGGRTLETAELSSLEVVHGKPFTSSTKRSSTSKLFGLLFPSSSSSSSKLKKQELINVKKEVTTDMSNNVSGSSQAENQFASERFVHDGRVSLLEPTPASHFSKRSVNIALSVLGLTRSEKDKLIMECQPPITVEKFSHLFDACVNTRMKEHVAHTFLSHDTQRKGELPLDETAELLQRCGVAASPWIANVKVDIAVPLQPPLNETSNEHFAHDNSKENVKVNCLPQLVLTIIKKTIRSGSVSTDLPESSFGPITSILGKHSASNDNTNNNISNNFISDDVVASTRYNTVSKVSSSLQQQPQGENATSQLNPKRNKARKERHIVQKEQAATMSVNTAEIVDCERREVRVCDIVDANVLNGSRTSVYWRDNCIYISGTLICTDIKHEEDYERIKTYVEAATYICILVKMFTILDSYNNYKATVEYPHVVRTLLLAEMTSASLQRKLRKLRSNYSLHGNSRSVIEKCTIRHAPRNLYIQNVFRNCYNASKQINKHAQSKTHYRNCRLANFLEDRLVESSLQETNNSHAKRSRNALPSAWVDNLTFCEPSNRQYTPLSVVCTSAQVQLPAAESIYFKFALINVRVPLLTPEAYQCYCLVSAMTSDGVFLPAIKIFVKKVAKSQTFANSETWMFDGVEDENDENVIYYRGHLLDKIFIECCYEREKLKSIDDGNQNINKNHYKNKSTNNISANTAHYSVLNTTNAIGDSVQDLNSRYSSLTTWSKSADTAPENITDEVMLSDNTVWSAGYAVLSLPTLQFSKKGISRKRLNIIADSVSNYEMTGSILESSASASASASASGGNQFFTNKTALPRAVENAQNLQWAKQKISVINILNENVEKHQNELGDKKKKTSSATTQARHVDIVIYSKETQKSETQYEKSKVDTYDLPSRSLLLRRHVLMISEIREAIRHIGLSSRHTRQALRQFNVNQLLHLVSDAKLLNQLIKLWKYKIEHMTSKQLESKVYRLEQLLLCAGSVYAIHHSTTLPVENIANLLVKKKRINLSSLLSSTSLSDATTAAITANNNCSQHPVII